MNIGIFGGTFDPVHKAHIEIAKQFIGKYLLDKCFFVPCNISPFKEADHLRPSNNADRMEMLRIAIAGNDNIEISDYEITKGGISYTIDTVKHFQKTFPDAKFFLLIGLDQASEFVRWKDFQDIAKLSSIVIANRNKNACSLTLPEIIERLGEYNIFPKLLGNDEMLDSSTVIRFRIFRKLPVGEIVDEKVLDYIISRKLYC